MKNLIIDGNEDIEPIFFDSLVQYEKYNEANGMPCWNENLNLTPSTQFSIIDEAIKTVEIRNKFNEYLATWDYLNDQVVNIQS